MTETRSVAAIYVLFLLIACAKPPSDALPDGRIVDLTHAFDERTIYWPTEEGFVLEQETAGITSGGYYYEANRFRGAEHGGTHIDAPIHFFAEGSSVDAIPVERLMGPAIAIDVSALCAADRDYEVSIGDFELWEDLHGRIPDGAIVLLYTGFGRYWPDRVTYMGTDARGPGGVAELHFPGLGSAAAEWLVRERDIAAIGLDTPSIDPGSSTLFESHRMLFAHDVPALENVANLDELPATGAYIVALPMKIRDGSGAPLRIIAILP